MSQRSGTTIWGKLRYWLLWIVVLLIALVGVHLLLKALPQSLFRDLFLGNLLATIMGVAVGIPVALELARRQQRSEATANAQETARKFARQKTQFLKMIQFSLLGNISFIESVAANAIPGAAIYPNIDMEQLEATAALKYEALDDLRLAGQLDLVRFHLRLLQRLLDLSLDFLFSKTRFDLEPQAFLAEHKRIIDRIHDQIPRALEVMNEAAVMIGEALGPDSREVDRNGGESTAREPASPAA